MRTAIMALVTLSIAAAVYLIACDGGEDPNGNEVYFGSLSGSITFTGTPRLDGKVFVAVHEPNPPSGPPAGYADVAGFDGVVAYNIERLNVGTYNYVSVYWQDPADLEMATQNHDMHPDPDNVEPLIISADEPDVVRDLTADWSQINLDSDGDAGPDGDEVPEYGTLWGTISFVGEPPDHGTIMVGIHGTYPASGPPESSQELDLPEPGETVDYELTYIRFATWDACAVYWVDPNDSDLLTKYHDLTTTDSDGRSVTFSAEEPEVELDFDADWSRI